MLNQENINDNNTSTIDEQLNTGLKNVNLNANSKSDTESNNESDSETYVNIKDVLDSQLKNIYQIQINNDKIVIKHIGHGSDIPDIIIKEDFGKYKNLNLYSCVYTNNEIDFLKTKINEDKFLPIVKLVEKLKPENKIYSLSVKIKCLFDYNEPFTQFSTFLTYSTDSSYVYHTELNKNINPSNLIEKMLEKIIELGINIL